MTHSLRQNSGSGNASARSNSLGNLRRSSGTVAAPRLSLFLPREHGLENPPRTAAAMDNILNMMQVAWRQISAARGSTVKLANPEHNLLMSLESARDFMLGMLRQPDPGRKHLEEIFGGDCSRIAQVRALLDAAKLSSRILGDDRWISCMNAVKSVESVLKKDCGAGARLSEAQDKELKKMRQRQMRFEARHLRGEFSPLKAAPSRLSTTSPFGMDPLSVTAGETFQRPRSASTSAIQGDETQASTAALKETWKVLRDAWESGRVFHLEDAKATCDRGDETSSSSSSKDRSADLSANEPLVQPPEFGEEPKAEMDIVPPFQAEQANGEDELTNNQLLKDLAQKMAVETQEEEAESSESSDDDVPMPENWGMQRQKRGSLIRPVQLPDYLLEPARLAGYGDSSCDVVEFQVGSHEEKIGIAFKILPPAGHLVVERITPQSPAEALQLPEGSRLLCVNGVHTGAIEAENFFDLMKQRPLQLLFLRPKSATLDVVPGAVAA